MNIQVLGTGCKKCDQLHEAALKAAESLGPDVTVEKNGDIDFIISLGVRVTPALVIDGEVVSSGPVLTPEQIVELASARKA